MRSNDHPEAASQRLMLDLFDHRLRRAPVGVTVQKGHAMPELVGPGMNGQQSRAHQPHRQRAGLQKQLGLQRLVGAEQQATGVCFLRNRRAAPEFLNPL